MLNLVNNAENSSEVTIFVVNMSIFFYYRNASSTDKLNILLKNVFVITYIGNAVKTIYKIIFFNVDNNIYCMRIKINNIKINLYYNIE